MPTLFNGISLPSGRQTSLEVQRKFSNMMEKPYSDCVENIDENYPSDLVKTLLKKGYAYTQQNCFLACYQSYVKKSCGCYDVIAYFISGTPDLNFSSIEFCTNANVVVCDSDV